MKNALVLVHLAFLFTLSLRAQTSVTDRYDDGTATGWGATNNRYIFTEADGILRVDANKTKSDGFSFTFSPIDISQNPVLNFKIRIAPGSDPLNISYVYLGDQAGKLTSGYKVNRRILPVDGFYELSYDFTGKLKTSKNEDVDPTQIKMIVICVNQNYPYIGTFYLDDLELGSAAMLKPNIENIPRIRRLKSWI